MSSRPPITKATDRALPRQSRPVQYFCALKKNLDTNNHSVLRLIISMLLTFNG